MISERESRLNGLALKEVSSSLMSSTPSSPQNISVRPRSSSIDSLTEHKPWWELQTDAATKNDRVKKDNIKATKEKAKTRQQEETKRKNEKIAENKKNGTLKSEEPVTSTRVRSGSVNAYTGRRRGSLSLEEIEDLPDIDDLCIDDLIGCGGILNENGPDEKDTERRGDAYDGALTSVVPMSPPLDAIIYDGAETIPSMGAVSTTPSS